MEEPAWSSCLRCFLLWPFQLNRFDIKRIMADVLITKKKWDNGGIREKAFISEIPDTRNTGMGKNFGFGSGIGYFRNKSLFPDSSVIPFLVIRTSASILFISNLLNWKGQSNKTSQTWAPRWILHVLQQIYVALDYNKVFDLAKEKKKLDKKDLTNMQKETNICFQYNAYSLSLIIF